MENEQDELMAVELIRLRAHEKQSRVRHIWTLKAEQIEEFFMSYPTSSVLGCTIRDLLQSPYLRLVKDEHRIYFGETVQHRKHGRGISLYRDGRVYEGGYYNNEKEGKGYEVYPNGNVYIGEYQKNKKHGDGVFYWFNMLGVKCEYYRGGWWSGLPSGRGVHERANGDLYQGEFRNGLKHGQGVQKFANGDSYAGLYVNGLPDGYGEYFWQDGSHYKGDFKQGLRNGFGIWKKSNKPHCQSYRGHYLLDKKSGYGLYVWNEGDYYKGHFYDDLKHGMGELYQDNISVYYGMWENGEKAPHLNKAKGVYDRTLKKDKGAARPMSQTQPRTNIRELSQGYVNPSTQRKRTEVTPDWKNQKQHARSQQPTDSKSQHTRSQQNLHNKSGIGSHPRKQHHTSNEPFHFPTPPQNRHQNNHQMPKGNQSSRRLLSSRGKEHDEDTKSTTGKSRCGHKNCIPKMDWFHPKRPK